MNDLDESIFTQLFNEAYQKYFGFPMTTPVSEADSHLLADSIVKETGLFINPKRIRAYSAFILVTNDSKQENPPVATLDTLARYVMGAPRTNEEQREEKESHYPYLFKYRDNFFRAQPSEKKDWLFPVVIIFIILIVAAIIAVVFFGVGQTPREIQTVQ